MKDFQYFSIFDRELKKNLVIFDYKKYEVFE